MKYAEKGYICDSLIILYDKKIETFEQIVGKKDEELLLSGQIITSLNDQVTKYSRREKFYKLSIGVLSGALVVFVIL